jgi:hypothetical protein
MVALSTILFVFSASEHADGVRSSYTQAHGASRAARVICEHVHTGKSPTATATVGLSEPVNGHDTTTVYIQGGPAYSQGTRIRVVVDPRDPGYAELAGAAYTPSEEWIIPLVIGLAVLLIFPFGMGVRFLVLLRSSLCWSRTRPWG